MVHLSDRIQQTFETDEPTVQLTNKSVDDVCSQPSPTLSSETVFQSYHPPLKREALGYDHHQTMMSPIVQKSHSSKKMTHQLTSSAAKIPGISTFQKASNSNRDHAHVKTESVEDFSDLSTNLLDTDDSNLQLNVMPDVLMQRSSFNRAALQSVSETRNPRSLSGMEKLQQMVSQAKSPESTLTYADSEIYLRHHADSQFSPDSLLHTSGYQADIFKQKDSRAPRFSCEICGDHFSSKSSLTNHHRIHTGDRPYKCKVCGNCFSQSGTLVNHVKIHTNAKAHKCEICGKGFNRAFVLREHMRTHTKEKPFKCCFCWSKFGQRSKLKAHMRIHTGELVPKLSVHGQHGRTSPLKHLKSHTASSINHPSCSICYKVCDNDVELIRHMQSHQISSAPSIRVGTCTDQVIEIDDSPQRSPLSEES